MEESADNHGEIPPELLMVMSASVAAYLDKDIRIGRRGSSIPCRRTPGDNRAGSSMPPPFAAMPMAAPAPVTGAPQGAAAGSDKACRSPIAGVVFKVVV